MTAAASPYVAVPATVLHRHRLFSLLSLQPHRPILFSSLLSFVFDFSSPNFKFFPLRFRFKTLNYPFSFNSEP
jgi:hypothetical protein